MTVARSWLEATLQRGGNTVDKSVPAQDDGRTPLPLHPDSPESPESPESREDCIRKSLVERLKSVCAHLAPADFDALVLQMTREQLRSEGVRSRKGDPC